MHRFHNFYPGPSGIPLSVLEEIEKSLYIYKDSHISALELNHRGLEIENIIYSIKDTLINLLSLPSSYSIFFFEGGASLHFSALAMNLNTSKSEVGYIISDHWSLRAFEEGQKILKNKAQIIYNNQNYFSLPTKEDLNIDPHKYDFIHITSNNTVAGTQFHELPVFDAPLIIDATSDILARPFDFEKNNIGILYAACQKNMGIAGLTVAIVRNDLIKEDSSIPSLLSYFFHKNTSIPHTLPVFNLYVLKLMLDWVKKEGGVQHFYNKSQLMSSTIYKILDQYPEFYITRVNPPDRSFINIPFTLNPPSEEKNLLKTALSENLIGLEGHHTKGGIRLSLYNSLEKSCLPSLSKLLLSQAQKSIN